MIYHLLQKRTLQHFIETDKCFFLHADHILQVRDVIYTAINDILEVDGLRCPQDKLGSVVSCAKKIFDVLQVLRKPSIRVLLLIFK